MCAIPELPADVLYIAWDIFVEDIQEQHNVLGIVQTRRPTVRPNAVTPAFNGPEDMTRRQRQELGLPSLDESKLLLVSLHNLFTEKVEHAATLEDEEDAMEVFHELDRALGKLNTGVEILSSDDSNFEERREDFGVRCLRGCKIVLEDLDYFLTGKLQTAETFEEMLDVAGVRHEVQEAIRYLLMGLAILRND